MMKKAFNKIKDLLFIISGFDLFILLIALPLFLFITPSRSWVFMSIPILWLVLFFQKKNPISNTPLNPILLLLSFQLLISLYVSYDLTLSLERIGGLLLGIALFFSSLRFIEQKHGSGLFLLLVMGAVGGLTILGIFTTDWMTNKIGGIGRLTLLLPSLGIDISNREGGVHPNILAGTLLWGLPLFGSLCLWVIFYFKDLSTHLKSIFLKFILIILMGSTLFVGLVFILTQSRAAYLALLITGIITVGLILPKKIIRYFLILILFITVISGIFMKSLGTDEVKTTIFPEELTSTTFSTVSLDSRMEIWSRAIYAIQDFPLTGLGMKTFSKIVLILYPLFSIPPEVDIGHAHNEFLQAALDLGIPGLVAFMALNITVFWMLFRTWKTYQISERQSNTSINIFNCRLNKFILLGALGGFLAHFIFGLIDAIALGSKPGFVFWLLIALITRLFLSSQKNQELQFLPGFLFKDTHENNISPE